MPNFDIDQDLKKLIPPLTDEETSLFQQNKLGFCGTSRACMNQAKIMPTPMSPSYWIWSFISGNSFTEEFSKTPMAGSRIPWHRFDTMTFRAQRMSPITEYPPPITRTEQDKQKALYVIQSVVGGPIKIGISDSPSERLSQLQTASPYKLQILECYDQKSQLEKKIHKHLARYQMHGEWFREEALSVFHDIIEE